MKKYAYSGGRETVEEHRKYGGNTETDVSYQYLSVFEYDDEKLKRIHDVQVFLGKIELIFYLGLPFW